MNLLAPNDRYEGREGGWEKGVREGLGREGLGREGRGRGEGGMERRIEDRG